MHAIIGVVIISLITFARSQTCSSPVECPMEKQQCTQVSFGIKQCTTCGVGYSQMAGGGSCYCDASRQYCSRITGQIGQCAPYSIYNKACQSDTECVTRIDNLVGSNLINEVLFCVNQLCKPCSPAIWAQYKIGDANGVYTCSGYSKYLSDLNRHYTTGWPLPKFMFRCASNGDIVVVNATIDWNYQYPYGDRSSWAYSTSTITGAAAPASGSTTGSPKGGNGQSSAAAGLLADVLWTAMIIAAIVIFKF